MAETPTTSSPGATGMDEPKLDEELAAGADISLQPSPSPLPSEEDDAIAAGPKKTGATRKAGVRKSVGEEARKAGETLKSGAGGVKQKAVDKAQALADQGKSAATAKLDGVARMIDDAASQVDEKLGEQYGQYARTAANSVASLAETLRGKEVDELIEDTRAFVRKSPVVAVGAAAALGFVLARLVKSGLDAADRASNDPDAA
jgi:hypothetical protein